VHGRYGDTGNSQYAVVHVDLTLFLMLVTLIPDRAHMEIHEHDGQGPDLHVVVVLTIGPARRRGASRSFAFLDTLKNTQKRRAVSFALRVYRSSLPAMDRQ
jgi:hypothetical protein